jgi:hypothetical protein
VLLPVAKSLGLHRQRIAFAQQVVKQQWLTLPHQNAGQRTIRRMFQVFDVFFINQQRSPKRFPIIRLQTAKYAASYWKTVWSAR